MTLTVERFTGEPSEWNRFVASTAGGTHCHRHEWLELIVDVFGHETLPWAARDGAGRLAGVLPLVEVRSALFGRYLVSMPFLNAGGPLGSEAAVLGLAEEAERAAVSRRSRLLELRSRIELPVGLRISHRKISVVRDLPSDRDALWGSLPSKLRSQIRRPEKDGIKIRFGPELVQDFYRIFARHMRDLGTPVLPRRFFEAVAERFGGDAWFGCAYLGAEPVAGGAGLRFGPSFELTWAAALRRHNRLAANMLLYWRFMEHAVEQGARRFDFGRCTPGGGTHRFKQQWGGQDVPLWWYQAGPEAATPAPGQGGLMGLAQGIWSRLPLPLTNTLGPWIVRGIP